MIDPRLLAEVVDLQQRIHREPELGYEEVATTLMVAEVLERWGVPHRVRDGGVGLVAEIGGTGPVVGYRADLDALPIDEQTGLAHASTRPGLMHACGHDAHTAIAAGVAATLASEDLAGRVRFIFQPAEEVFPGGAGDLVEEGVTEGLVAIVALHADPSLPAGEAGIKSGPITSSSDRFTIVLSGPGGHTARPHETPDTLLAAGKLISEMEAILSRRLDPRLPRAVAFGAVHGGEAANVIPASVRLEGTVRIADAYAWDAMGPLFAEVVEDIVAPLGVQIHLTYEQGIAPVVNDEAVTATVASAARAVLGAASVHPTYTSMGAEDFSEFTRLVPGTLLRLGSAGAGRPFAPLHSSRFVFDEAGLGPGVAVAAESLRRLIAQASSKP